MKKYQTSKKYRKLNKRRASKSLRRKLLFNKYRVQRNKKFHGKSKVSREEILYQEKFSDYTWLKAPSKLSFIENPEGVLNFIDKLKRQYDRENKVFVNLEKVEQISYDAIVVLLSIMVKFKSNKIPFNGNFPKNLDSRRILEESGFFKYLYQRFKEEERYNLEQTSSIHTHAWKDVDSELSARLIEQATKTVWGGQRRCQGVQRTLIELMLNTNNHADDSKKGEKHWWLSVHHDIENEKVSFAFIDFGVGVFTSLNNKRKESKFYGVLQKLGEKVKYGDNSDLLKLILDGTLHRTATGKSYHGKGLPGINKALERNQISNLNIITNDVHAKVAEDQFQVLKSNFSGTFVYWELINSNLSCNGVNYN